MSPLASTKMFCGNVAVALLLALGATACCKSEKQETHGTEHDPAHGEHTSEGEVAPAPPEEHHEAPPAARPRPRIPAPPEAPAGLNHIGSYVARLSERDHVNPKGARLSTVPMILQQDRGNYHALNARDPEDTADDFFTSIQVRLQFKDYIEMGGAVPASVSQAILNGTPLVQVSIYESRDHSTNAVRIQFIEP